MADIEGKLVGRVRANIRNWDEAFSQSGRAFGPSRPIAPPRELGR